DPLRDRASVAQAHFRPIRSSAFYDPGNPAANEAAKEGREAAQADAKLLQLRQSYLRIAKRAARSSTVLMALTGGSTMSPPTDPKVFRSGRDFAAWIGIVPREDSTGGKQKLGPISKQGDRYLRRILVVGACAVLRYARHRPEKYPWLAQLLARKPFKVVAVALANKMARTAWALLAKGGTYRAPALAAAAYGVLRRYLVRGVRSRIA